MARIQVLPLPSEVVGELVVQPFALVVDQFEGDSYDYSQAVRDLAEALGAQGVVLVAGTLDVVIPEIR